MLHTSCLLAVYSAMLVAGHVEIQYFVPESNA